MKAQIPLMAGTAMLVLFGALPQAVGCDCARLWTTEQSYAAAHVVFDGVARSIRVFHDKGFDLEEVVYDSIHTWKGAGAQFVIVTEVFECGFPVREGDHALIFGFKRDDGAYWTWRCVGSHEGAADSKSEIEALTRLSAGNDAAVSSGSEPSASNRAALYLALIAVAGIGMALFLRWKLGR